MTVFQILKNLKFEEPHDVVDLNSILSIFSGKDHCGIYILHFSDGSHYVGQSVNIPNRFLQHRKTFKDIEKISFKTINKHDVDDTEKMVIGMLEQITILRNISLASMPDKESYLNNIINDDDIYSWLKSKKIDIKYKQRTHNENLRNKYVIKFNKLIQNDVFLNECLPVMKNYISKCIPEPYLTEISFWGCSCLNQKRKGLLLYSRINIFWQEVFTTGFDMEYNSAFFTWHVAKSPFSRLQRGNIIQHYRGIRSLYYSDERKNIYQSGGQDQCMLEVTTKEDALNLLDDDLFIYAAKLFNIRNMKKGNLTYAHTHCMGLADYILP